LEILRSNNEQGGINVLSALVSTEVLQLGSMSLQTGNVATRVKYYSFYQGMSFDIEINVSEFMYRLHIIRSPSAPSYWPWKKYCH
jgi:hypothetical protein